MYSGSIVMPSYVVARSRSMAASGDRRARAVERRGDGGQPLLAVGGGELAGEHELVGDRRAISHGARIGVGVRAGPSPVRRQASGADGPSDRVPHRVNALSCKENPLDASGDFGEGDAVAEVVELADEVVASLVGVGASGEPVAAEVVVVAVVGEQVPADDEDRVADGDGGFAVADASA